MRSTDRDRAERRRPAACCALPNRFLLQGPVPTLPSRTPFLPGGTTFPRSGPDAPAIRRPGRDRFSSPGPRDRPISPGGLPSARPGERHVGEGLRPLAPANPDAPWRQLTLEILRKRNALTSGRRPEPGIDSVASAADTQPRGYHVGRIIARHFRHLPASLNLQATRTTPFVVAAFLAQQYIVSIRAFPGKGRLVLSLREVAGQVAGVNSGRAAEGPVESRTEPESKGDSDESDVVYHDLNCPGKDDSCFPRESTNRPFFDIIVRHFQVKTRLTAPQGA